MADDIFVNAGQVRFLYGNSWYEMPEAEFLPPNQATRHVELPGPGRVVILFGLNNKERTANIISLTHQQQPWENVNIVMAKECGEPDEMFAFFYYKKQWYKVRHQFVGIKPKVIFVMPDGAILFAIGDDDVGVYVRELYPKELLLDYEKAVEPTPCEPPGWIN